jgi:DNA primase
VEHDDLVVKNGYWRWPSRGIDGNAIDFFMRVEGKAFNQAMEILAGRSHHSENRSTLPSYTQRPKTQQTPSL